MERSSTKRQTVVFNQLSERQFKRGHGTGRLTTKRPIKFDTLLLSGEKPVCPTSSSLYKNISTSLKENVNPESRISQNVDDFWAGQAPKRISAVARRKLTGAKETSDETNQQPLGDRKTRHAGSRRVGGVGGKRTLGAKPKKLDVYIDTDLVADWDKEKLEVEEEEPCTIASSEPFMSAQLTALRASLPLLNTVDYRVTAVSGTCSPIVKTTHKQVELCSVDGELKEKTPGDDIQADDMKSVSSSEDMDLSSGEYPEIFMQNIMNPHDCTPDLATLMEMDWNTSYPPPKIALENAFNSQGSPLHPQQEDTNNGTPMLSPIPHPNPLTVDMSRRQLLTEMGKSCQRKLPFGSSSSSSSLDTGEFFQVANMHRPQKPTERKSCSRLAFPHKGSDAKMVHVAPHQGTESESYVCDVIKSQECCSMHAKPSIGKSESRQKSGKSVASPGVDGARTSTLTARKFKQTEKAGLSRSARALFLEGPNEENPRFDKPRFSPIKSAKTNQVEKMRMVNQSAAKSPRFEDAAVEGNHYNEKSESIIEESQEATELEVSLPVDIEKSSQPAANLQTRPDNFTTETQTCEDLQNHHDEITCRTQLSNDPQSQADNITAEKTQPEPVRQTQVKRTRRKDPIRRCSLEGSENGLTWKDGVRRSQRRRVRPLQWWRGEKLLYGRVHDSLTTVIGIKQSSPGAYSRGIRTPFIVESFVSPKYNDLVRLAAI